VSRLATDTVDLHTLLSVPPGTYDEWVRTPSMRCGTYVLGAGATDTQSPHDEDEVYVVLAGAGTVEVDGRRTPVQQGSLVYVAAGVDHRFVDVTEQLTLLVVFGGAVREEQA
jgi:mannose-6-phosphate isomerase-like protein (cupin superfamily)